MRDIKAAFLQIELEGGLSRKDFEGLMKLFSPTAKLVSVTFDSNSSSALGFIEVEWLMDVLNGDYSLLEKRVVEILNDTNLEVESGIYEYEGANFFLNYSLESDFKTNIEGSTMITLSTGHLTPKTRQEESFSFCDSPGLIAYEKADYGWFIYLGTLEGVSELPKDLAEVVLFAKSLGYDVLCLDCDGETCEDLPIYEDDYEE